MTMIRRLVAVWAITLIMNLLFPVVSFAQVSATMLDYQSAITTAPATTAERTTVAKRVGNDSDLQSETGHQVQTLSGLIRLLLAPNTTIPSAGGVIRQFEQQNAQTYYRVFSGDATTGKWLTSVPPRSSAYAQEALALPSWNKANMIQEVRVPAGTMLERSRAIPVPEWGRLRGGAEQFQLLDEIPLNSFGSGVSLR